MLLDYMKYHQPWGISYLESLKPQLIVESYLRECQSLGLCTVASLASTEDPINLPKKKHGNTTRFN